MGNRIAIGSFSIPVCERARVERGNRPNERIEGRYNRKILCGRPVGNYAGFPWSKPPISDSAHSNVRVV